MVKVKWDIGCKSCPVHSKQFINASLQDFSLWGNVMWWENESPPTDLDRRRTWARSDSQSLSVRSELPYMPDHSHSGRSGRGRARCERRESHFLLWVCVARHDFHVHCVCAPGCSIISFRCWFSSSCVFIRVHCRISICPHMAQKLCGSLLKISPVP